MSGDPRADGRARRGHRVDREARVHARLAARVRHGRRCSSSRFGVLGFGDDWIVMGLVLYATTFLAGVLFLGPESGRIGVLAEQGSPEAGPRTMRLDHVRPPRPRPPLLDPLRHGREARRLRLGVPRGARRQRRWPAGSSTGATRSRSRSLPPGPPRASRTRARHRLGRRRAWHDAADARHPRAQCGSFRPARSPSCSPTSRARRGSCTSWATSTRSCWPSTGALLRDAFSRYGGVEVDTQGDALFVAFARASDAVSAAAEGQEALAGGRCACAWASTRASRSSPTRATSGSTSTAAHAS